MLIAAFHPWRGCSQKMNNRMYPNNDPIVLILCGEPCRGLGRLAAPVLRKALAMGSVGSAWLA